MVVGNISTHYDSKKLGEHHKSRVQNKIMEICKAHFLNSCRATAGTYSCAIDCFLELQLHASEDLFLQMV